MNLALPPRGQSVTSPNLAALQGREPQAPISLRSGRIVFHKFDRDNTQHAIPAPGSPEMTESEWEDYCGQITSAMRKEGARRIS